MARIRELGAQFVMLFAMILLIFVQPDLGGATINLAIAAVILFASGISYFVGVGVFAGAVAAFEWILVPLVSRMPQSAFANFISYGGFRFPESV